MVNLHPQKASTRVIVNTIAQYSRSLINICIALYSTRLVLAALGVNDYGIYSLVAGVVAMLSFISNALVSTTQRFLSYHQAKSDVNELQKLFGNILLLHIGFSVILVAVLEALQPWLFGGALNIPPESIGAAKYVYQCSIFMVTASFLSAPFLALLISHENIVYSSIVQVIDSVLRLLIALSLTYFFTESRLEMYTTMLCCISVFDFLSYSLYTYRKYEECIIPRLRHLRKSVIKKIADFLVWQIYSTGCIIGRTQGTAIVLNKFFGTAINAAFGIAQQVSGAISFVSSSLLNSLNPQIVKSEGAGDREQMFKLAMMGSKFSTFLLATFVMPLVAEMPQILGLWLKTVPDYAVLFCRVILITALVDQLTISLGTANSAIGNVRPYSLTVNTLKFLTVPIIALCLYFGMNLRIAIWVYAIMEFICAMCRIVFLHKSGGLNVKEYFKKVFGALLIPMAFIILSYTLISYLQIKLLYVLPIILGITIIYGFLIYKTGLSDNEHQLIKSLFGRIMRRTV